MFNLRLSIIAAITAFCISLVFGVFSGSTVSYILIRALVCGGIFFGLAAAINLAVYRFLPELMETSGAGGGNILPDDGFSEPGSSLDISVGDSPRGQGASYSGGGSDEVDDFDDGETMFPQGIGGRAGVREPGIDQNREDGYNVNARGEAASPGQRGAAAIPDFDNVETVDALPELKAVNTSSSSGEDDDFPELESVGFDPGMPSAGGGTSETKRKQSKKNPIGDFNAKDVASAIQTVLKRDEKG